MVVIGEALLSGSACETVEPLSFSLSRKGQAFCVECQGWIMMGHRKSTASIQKEDHAAHTTAEPAAVS